MTRLEKIQLAIEKGYTCDPETGDVFGPKGNLITSKTKSGYKNIVLTSNKIKYHLKQHHFIFYITYEEIADEIDHINRDRTDNRISNLRCVSSQQNDFNRTSRGYYYDKKRNKYQSIIGINGKNIHLGRFNTAQGAKQAYLDAKQKYHVI